MRFTLPFALLEKLRQRRAQMGPDAIERAHDAFLLDPGMGPALYLTADGRVLVDASEWDDVPLHEATPSEACAAIVIGAKKTQLGELLELLPPKQGPRCPRCLGGRWLPEISVICDACSGLGWIGLFSPSSRD